MQYITLHFQSITHRIPQISLTDTVKRTVTTDGYNNSSTDNEKKEKRERKRLYELFLFTHAPFTVWMNLFHFSSFILTLFIAFSV